jgi:Leucine-rich repeat (LRR) protein
VTSVNEKITIIGQPSNYIDEVTTYLSFNGESVINYIPTEFFKYFPKLTSIEAYSASVTTLTENAFNYCPNVNFISLSQNSISHVPARIASSCYVVESLSLNDNRIKTIDQDAFEGMESLKWIYMYQNQLTCLPPNLFQNNLAINNIEVSYNNLTALHPKLFRNLIQLQQASFGYNNISYIPKFDLSHSGVLNYGASMLNLYGNPIIAINPDFLMDLLFSRDAFSSMGPLNIQFQPVEQPTCVDDSHPNNQMLFSIYGWNWVQTHVAFKYRTSCYKNWNNEMASNSQVTCGSV